MSYVQLSEGSFQVVYPLGLLSRFSPELSESYMAMAGKLFTFTYLVVVERFPAPSVCALLGQRRS